MEQSYILYLLQQLPPRVTAAMLNYAARRMPYRKLQREEFRRCLVAVTLHILKFYKIKLKKKQAILYDELITLMVELFSYRIKPKILLDSSLQISCFEYQPVPSSNGEFEKPPPNITSPPLCSQVVNP